MYFWDLIQSSDFFFKDGEFQNVEREKPKSYRKPGCLRLATQLVLREIHSFNPLTINQCFALVLAGAAKSAVATVTVAGLSCVKRVGDLF